MMGASKGAAPNWIETAPAKGSYRSIFKWGDPHAYKHPNAKLVQLLKETFGLGDDHFKVPVSHGNRPVAHGQPSRVITRDHAAAIARIVGDENVSVDDYDRLKFATGKTLEESLRLRQGEVRAVADLVVHPRHKDDVRRLVGYCDREQIPVYVYGGGSSVNFGLWPSRGGVTLVMGTHMNRVVRLNETNQTVTVQAGIMGPDYEGALNDAPRRYHSRHRYTGGHFPQSFEFSSVGGWVVTLGSGQLSSYYGDACDLVVSQEVVTPVGDLKTLDFPATANGPSVNRMMIGSEGCFGVLVEVTLKIFRCLPENRRYFSFVFPSWTKAVEAGREIAQGQFGMPAVFRISDEEETHIGLKLYGIDGTLMDRLMRLRGFQPMRRCLMIASSEGEKRFAGNVKRCAKRICRRFGGMSLTGYPVRQWEPGRFTDPYLRDDLNDYGILIETLDTAVTWDRLHPLHQGVRRLIKARPETLCMTHASHFYAQGTNLYFIFITRAADIDDFVAFQEKILHAFEQFGGSPTHHHGIGKLFSPWLQPHLGDAQMAVLRALKGHFDPNTIMNPGGQLGLDTGGRHWRDIC
ncbi:FAD-binding oxidoreductase [Desulfosarcina alkanivorans]|nr:FAD-binding oxidoreductase [Desulfosarcina alkanivorans]